MLKIDTRLFQIVLFCVISISLLQTSYAQIQFDSEKQIVLSDSLLNDPIAQDLLKKIEQTRKMITELEQKEFEKKVLEQFISSKNLFGQGGAKVHTTGQIYAARLYGKAQKILQGRCKGCLLVQ